jgi:hypothetical protein
MDILSNIINSIKNIYQEKNITPKFIILCKKNGERKNIYQKEPKEMISKFNDIEITHNIYAQNIIPIAEIIHDCSYIIIVTDDDNEILINDNFLLKNILGNIQNTSEKQYFIAYMFNTPIYICDNYTKNTEHKKYNCLNKHMLIIYSSAIITSLFIIKCIIKTSMKLLQK